MTDSEVHGPIDFLIIEFTGDTRGDATARALFDLVEQGIVRLYDLMVVAKDADGTGSEVDLTTSSDERLKSLAVFAGARSGLLGGDDVRDAVGVIDPGTIAVVVLYENLWAAPFVAAARSEGAEVVATSRLTAQEIMDALDAAESAD